MPDLKRLILEMHRRSLWQVLGIYLVGAWIGYEVIQSLTEGLGLPQWFPALAIVLFIVGLPIVVASACVHEEAAPISEPSKPGAQGEAAELEIGPQPGRTVPRRHLVTWRNTGLIFVVVLALWGLVATAWLFLGERQPAPELKSIAVLPFVNLSADPDNEYFSDGITGDIINQLSTIAALRVTSRTTVMQLKGTGKTVRQIGEELDVAAVLEGEVQRVGDRVRINAQLIDAGTDEHLWSDQYNREMTDIFAIQSDVAQRIANALEARLTPAEQAEIERRPTESLEAYDYYLRGNAFSEAGWTVGSEEQDSVWSAAIEMYERAVEEDPGFVDAHYYLAYLHLAMRWYGHDRTDARLAMAKEEVDKVVELDPDSPAAHLILGRYYYWGFRDYARALSEYLIAQDKLPSGDLSRQIGYVQRRLGNCEEAVINLERYLERYPTSSFTAEQIGRTYRGMRRYDEAVRYLDRAIALAPDWAVPYAVKAWTSLMQGDTEGAREVLESAPQTIDPSEFRPAWFWLNIMERDFDAALEQAVASANEDLPPANVHLAHATVYHLRGEEQPARIHYDRGRELLEIVVQEQPDNRTTRWRLAQVYAGLGRKDDALREANVALELMPTSRDAWLAPEVTENVAYVYMMAGEYDAAIDRLDFVLSVCSRSTVSVPLLRIDPRLDPLRDHPRFQALLERYE